MTDKNVQAVDKADPLKVDTYADNIADYDNPKIGVTVSSFDYLIGKLFNHTELLGLPERQLSAYKGSVRDMFWDWFNDQLPNPHALADPSRQGRIAQGIEPHTTTPTGEKVHFIR